MRRVHDFHHRVINVITALVDLDPPADSPEGRLLAALAAATQSYERERWPIGPPTPAEAAAFRAEQEGQ